MGPACRCAGGGLRLKVTKCRQRVDTARITCTPPPPTPSQVTMLLG